MWFLVVSCLSIAWTVSASEFIAYEVVCFDTTVCDESDDDLLLWTHTWSVPQTPRLLVISEIFDQPIFPVVAAAVIRGPPV